MHQCNTRIQMASLHCCAFGNTHSSDHSTRSGGTPTKVSHATHCIQRCASATLWYYRLARSKLHRCDGHHPQADHLHLLRQQVLQHRCGLQRYLLGCCLLAPRIAVTLRQPDSRSEVHRKTRNTRETRSCCTGDHRELLAFHLHQQVLQHRCGLLSNEVDLRQRFATVALQRLVRSDPGTPLWYTTCHRGRIFLHSSERAGRSLETTPRDPAGSTTPLSMTSPSPTQLGRADLSLEPNGKKPSAI